MLTRILTYDFFLVSQEASGTYRDYIADSCRSRMLV